MRKSYRVTLRKQNSFTAVYNRGKSKGCKYAVVLFKKNGLNYSRTAYVASKKVGNSVNRNRARRLMKAAYRNMDNKIVRGYDVIFIARKDITEAKCDEVRKSLYGAIRAAGLFEA